MNNTKYGPAEVKKVQNRLLEMAKIIHNILDENNIPYFITFGTLLGAVRHNGFIPWDDDLDIFLFDDTYDEAIRVLRNNIPDDMFLEDGESEPLYFHAWAHIKDNNSKAVCQQYPQDNIYKNHGVSIDLYRAVKMDENDVEMFRALENRKYIDRKRNVGLMTDNEYAQAVSQNDERIRKAAEKSNAGSGAAVFGMVLKQEKMYCDDVLPLRKYKFCDTELWGPNNYDSILRHFYNEYMELPSDEEKIPHYEYVEFYK